MFSNVARVLLRSILAISSRLINQAGQVCGLALTRLAFVSLDRIDQPTADSNDQLGSPHTSFQEKIKNTPFLLFSFMIFFLSLFCAAL